VSSQLSQLCPGEVQAHDRLTEPLATVARLGTTLERLLELSGRDGTLRDQQFTDSAALGAERG
jgi:hypothetical protein